MTNSSEARSNPSGTAGRAAFACCLLPAHVFRPRGACACPPLLSAYVLRPLGCRQGSLRLIGMTCAVERLTSCQTADNGELAGTASETWLDDTSRWLAG